MGIWESLTSGVKNHFDKKKEEREWMENLQREANAQQKILFESEFRKNALEVAKAKAKKDAANLSGLQKLRAMNRARNLTNSGQNENLLSKLSQFTQKNIAKREENLKRTAELREAAEKMKNNPITNKPGMTIPKRKPFGSSNWKM